MKHEQEIVANGKCKLKTSIDKSVRFAYNNSLEVA
jgi:hypothetical protein